MNDLVFQEFTDGYYVGTNGTDYGNAFSSKNSIPKILEIPSHYNGKSVIAIGSHAFCQCIQIEEVHIHASIKAIYVWAFHGCYNLKYINIPSSCELIDESAIDCRHENGTEPKDDDIYNTGTLKVVFEPDTKIKELKHAAIANAAKMIIYIYNKVDATCGWNFGSDLESKYVIYSPYIYKFCSMYKTTIIQNITCKQNIRISLSCFFILLSMQ